MTNKNTPYNTQEKNNDSALKKTAKITGGLAGGYAGKVLGNRMLDTVCNVLPGAHIKIGCKVASKATGMVGGVKHGAEAGESVYDKSSYIVNKLPAIPKSRSNYPYISEGRISEIYNYHNIDRKFSSNLGEQESVSSAKINNYAAGSTTTQKNSIPAPQKNPFNKGQCLQPQNDSDIIFSAAEPQQTNNQYQSHVETLHQQVLPKLKEVVDAWSAGKKKEAIALAQRDQFNNAMKTTHEITGTLSNIANIAGTSPEVHKAIAIASGVANFGFAAYALTIGSPLTAIYCLTGGIASLVGAFGGSDTKEIDGYSMMLSALQDMYYQLSQEIRSGFKNIEEKIDKNSILLLDGFSVRNLQYESITEQLKALRQNINKNHFDLNSGQTDIYKLILDQISLNSDAKLEETLGNIEHNLQNILNNQFIDEKSYNERKAYIKTIIEKDSKSSVLTGHINVGDEFISSNNVMIDNRHHFHVNFLADLYNKRFNDNDESHIERLSSPLIWSYATLVLSDLMSRYYEQKTQKVSHYDFDLIKLACSEGAKINNFINQVSKPSFITRIVNNHNTKISNLLDAFTEQTKIYDHMVQKVVANDFKNNMLNIFLLNQENEYEQFKAEIGKIEIKSNYSEPSEWWRKVYVSVNSTYFPCNHAYGNHLPNEYIQEQRKFINESIGNTIDSHNSKTDYLTKITRRIKNLTNKLNASDTLTTPDYIPMFVYPAENSEIKELILPWPNEVQIEIPSKFKKLWMHGIADIETRYSVNKNVFNISTVLISKLTNINVPELYLTSANFEYDPGIYVGKEALWMFFVGGRKFQLGVSAIYENHIHPMRMEMNHHRYSIFAPYKFVMNYKGLGYSINTQQLSKACNLSNNAIEQVYNQQLRLKQEEMMHQVRRNDVLILKKDGQHNLTRAVVELNASYKIMHQFLAFAFDGALPSLLKESNFIFNKTMFLEYLKDKNINNKQILRILSDSLKVSSMINNQSLSLLNSSKMQPSLFKYVFNTFNDFASSVNPNQIMASSKVKALQTTLKSMSKAYISVIHQVGPEACNIMFSALVKESIPDGVHLDIVSDNGKNIYANIKEEEGQKNNSLTYSIKLFDFKDNALTHKSSANSTVSEIHQDEPSIDFPFKNAS